MNIVKDLLGEYIKVTNEEKIKVYKENMNNEELTRCAKKYSYTLHDYKKLLNINPNEEVVKTLLSIKDELKSFNYDNDIFVYAIKDDIEYNYSANIRVIEVVFFIKNTIIVNFNHILEEFANGYSNVLLTKDKIFSVIKHNEDLNKPYTNKLKEMDLDRDYFNSSHDLVEIKTVEIEEHAIDFKDNISRLEEEDTLRYIISDIINRKSEGKLVYLYNAEVIEHVDIFNNDAKKKVKLELGYKIV